MIFLYRFGKLAESSGPESEGWYAVHDLSRPLGTRNITFCKIIEPANNSNRVVSLTYIS